MAKDGGYQKAKGRKYNEPHIRLYAWILPTVLERLSGNETKLLLYMMSFENGSNNGAIIMAAREAAKGIGVDKNTALSCLHGLDRAGFIRPAERGFFAVKGGPGTTWRLTFVPALGKAATHEWRNPPAERISWSENFTSAVGKTHTAGRKEASAVGKTHTALNGKPPKSNLVAVGNTHTQTIAIGRGREQAGVEAGWDPQNASGPFPNESEPIRRQVRSVWMDMGVSGRRSMARTVGLTPEQLHEYVHGHLVLTNGKLQALQSAALAAA
jgi:hypothetical protein